MRRFFLPMALVSAMSLPPASSGFGDPPNLAPAEPTAKESVTDTYFGTTVRDDYRWLEQLDNPKVKAWAEAQNTRAEGFLAALPGRSQLAREIKKLVTSEPLSYGDLQVVSGKIFALKFDPTKQQ